MEILRTPDERFAGLAGYPFAPHYLEWQGLRMHYVDEGVGPPMLLLHGEPTWSYLYRTIIPPLVAAGYRCLAPDYTGFGKSDKVVEDSWYVIERHVESIRHFIDSLDLRNITIVVHDWGGPIGLRQVVDQPDRFSRLVILNTWLHHEGYQYSDGIRRWRQWATAFGAGTGDLPCGFVVADMNRLPLDPASAEKVRQAYDAPFPDARSKAGPRRFPWCIPFAQPEEGNARDQERCFEALKSWRKPVHFIFGDRDVVFTTEWERQWAAMMSGATVDTVPGPHFPQEESGPLIAEIMLRYMRS